jgi:hypothetical protein
MSESDSRNGAKSVSNLRDEWVSITEAAQRLGILERRARRLADKLTVTDRTPTDERPSRVRLSAMAHLVGVTVTDRTPTVMPSEAEEELRQQVSDRDAEIASLRSELTVQRGALCEEIARRNAIEEELRRPSEVEAELRQRITDKDAENVYLRSELTAQRETHSGEIQRRDQAEAEFRRMVFAAQQTAIDYKRQLDELRALPPAPTETVTPEPVDAGRNGAGTSVGKKSWWARLFKQTT